jgi:hypothetical protein
MLELNCLDFIQYKVDGELLIKNIKIYNLRVIRFVRIYIPIFTFL